MHRPKKPLKKGKPSMGFGSKVLFTDSALARLHAYGIHQLDDDITIASFDNMGLHETEDRGPDVDENTVVLLSNSSRARFGDLYVPPPVKRLSLSMVRTIDEFVESWHVPSPGEPPAIRTITRRQFKLLELMADFVDDDDDEDDEDWIA